MDSSWFPALSCLPTGFLVSALLCIILLTTWVHSWLHSFPAKRNTGFEPPTVPYLLPYVGHLVQYLSDPGGLLQRCSKAFPDTPFSLQLPGAKFHIFTSPKTAFFIFTKPRDFICEPVVASMMSNALELDGVDYEKFDVPISPHRKSPTFTPAQQESFVFVTRNHSLYLKHLSGKALDPVMELYLDSFLAVIQQSLPTGKTPEPRAIRLHETLQKLVFDASCVTFFGRRIFRICPQIWEHWRSFNEASYIGVRSRASFYLRPWTLGGRRRLLQAFDRWVDTDLEPWEDNREMWSEKWGVKLNWERERMSRDHEMTIRGRSCVHVSFLWVIVTNTTPMLAWLISALLAHQEVLERFRAIVETFMTLDKASSFDSASFCADPFIQAVWKEALRLGVSSSAARVVTRQTEIEGYIVKPGSVILIPTRVLHFDENVFTQPDQFNPWRWINEQTEKDGNPLPAVSADQLKKQNDSFRPFGGGTGVCSGRFIAEREVLMAAAVLLHRFDFLVQPGQQIAQPNLNPRALGAMYPLVDPNVTVRSRR